MTAERLEIKAVSGEILGEVTLTSQGKNKTLVKGNLLSEGLYSFPLYKMRGMVKLKAMKKFARKYEITREPLNSYSQ